MTQNFFDFIRLHMISIQAVCSYIQSTMLNGYEMWEASSSRNEAQSLTMKSLLHRCVWNISGCFGQQRVAENHLERFDPNVLLKMFWVLSVCPSIIGKAVVFVGLFWGETNGDSFDASEVVVTKHEMCHLKLLGLSWKVDHHKTP